MSRVSLFILAFAAGLTACASAADQAARARDEYQVAMDEGNLPAAKNAMLRAVQAKDDEAVSWMGLGRAQIGLGDMGGAYQSYARANELDRGNVEALQAMADLSLLAGKVRDAERYANQLQLLQPGTTGPLTTQGFIALARKRPDDAITKADAVLAMRPFDPSATILKARALSSKLAYAEGAELLEAQMAARGPEKSILSTLLALYGRAGDGRAVLRTRARLAAVEPANDEFAFDYATELYRSGNAAEARAITTRLAAAGPGPERLEKILALWTTHEKPAQAFRNVAGLVDRAAPPARVRYADFFVSAGQPEKAEAILRAQAGLPVTAENADALAVAAHARGLRGEAGAALPILDAVLRFDPSNDLALRARVDFDLAAGRSDRTLADARRLTIDNPRSAEDRIRLAKCYVLRGNRSLAETTYWTAFNEIPGNPLLYEALKTFLADLGLADSGRARSLALLTRRYEEQKRNIAAAAFARG